MNLDQILSEKYVNELHKPLVNFEGCVLPKPFEILMSDIKNLEVRDDDVWITSFPKSGTTWSQEMIWLIANNFDYEQAKEVPLVVRYPFLEISAILDFKTYSLKHPNFKGTPEMLDSVKSVTNLKGRRFIKTHLPWNLLPIQIQNGTKKPKIIHVIRNPKDILVSFYHHCTLLQGFTGTLEEYFHLFISGKMDYCPYFDNIFTFWAKRHLDNVLLIKYEDMQRDLRGIIDTVAKFLNKSVPNEEMEKLLKHLSFNEMKNNLAVNYDALVDVIADTKSWKVPEKKFMRSGKSGNYKEELTPKMIAQLDEWIQANCKETGIDFS